MKNKVTEILGWYGVVAVVVAYALANLGFLQMNSLLYQILNLTGAIGILVDAWNDRNYQPVVLNAIWAIIAVVVLVRLFF